MVCEGLTLRYRARRRALHASSHPTLRAGPQSLAYRVISVSELAGRDPLRGQRLAHGQHGRADHVRLVIIDRAGPHLRLGHALDELRQRPGFILGQFQLNDHAGLRFPLRNDFQMRATQPSPFARAYRSGSIGGRQCGFFGSGKASLRGEGKTRLEARLTGSGGMLRSWAGPSSLKL